MYILKKLLEHLMFLLGMAGFMSAIIWIFCWCGAWDIGAISQSEAYSMYIFAFTPATLGAGFFYGAYKLEKHIEKEYFE